RRRLPLCSTLVPYTTLFRSAGVVGQQAVQPAHHLGLAAHREAPFTQLRERLRVALRKLAATDDAGGVGEEGQWPLGGDAGIELRSEEHTSELQSRENLVCRL